MPRKHKPIYASIKPRTTNPPTLESSRNAASSSTPPPPQTVNDRIQQLRREQTPRATPQRRDEVTEVAGIRRTLGQGRRPPPGPAAPSSWLSRSRWAPEYVRKSRAYAGHGNGVGRFCKLARAHDEEYKRLPSSRSLVHQCLRTFALHWEEISIYEQHYLSALPVALKEALLSYLSLYGERSCMDFKSFKILFQGDQEVEGASGSADVQFLDLTGLLNEGYTLKDLEKSLQRSGANVAVTSSMADLSRSTSKRQDKALVEVADSWEDEAEDSSSSVLPATLTVPIFPNLTRLSLAHPGTAASWTDLLALSPHLKTLTHLSLAYWPRPSTTPNAATTSMVARHATVSLGGTHFYADLDDDWHEAANILRRLSLNTYCLKWLDLEGCTWLRALTWDLPSNAPPYTSNVFMSGADEWVRPASSPGPDWNAAWRQIEYVNFFQGWIPKDTKSLQNMPAGVVPAQLMQWLREHGKKDAVKGLLGDGGAYGAVEWVEKEKVARSVGFAIQSLRKVGSGVYCRVDYGWGGEV
ncbi:hypothetical protein BU23DRAFT_255737 [Bimuria novae-zelandiae CBS 107.79]|uniref:Tafazzin n=1 Tax=Bimuria novae-zelandiae CBS 107.79 TaxID=1447943 RepID=A0A6A5UVV4_9PLEO|nr:hypothetical protein BU23DRAFT_255737 [Bimuria novae-zelandiae CBS 107.79]